VVLAHVPDPCPSGPFRHECPECHEVTWWVVRIPPWKPGWRADVYRVAGPDGGRALCLHYAAGRGFGSEHVPWGRCILPAGHGRGRRDEYGDLECRRSKQRPPTPAPTGDHYSYAERKQLRIEEERRAERADGPGSFRYAPDVSPPRFEWWK
jgi:hypothetical protein